MVEWLGHWVCMRRIDAVAFGSNPVLTSGLDWFLVVPDSTLPRFVNSQLLPPTSCIGVLNNDCFFSSLNCFFQIIKGGVPVN